MKWLKALQIGYGVLQVLAKEDVKIKGRDTGKVVEAVQEAIETTQTIKEIVTNKPLPPKRVRPAA